MAVAPSASYSLTVRLEAMLFIPSVFNKAEVPAVADGVARAAHATGVARRPRRRHVATTA